MAQTVLSRITSKGQVTIPEPIRDQCHLQPGDQLEWRMSGAGVIELRRVGGDIRGLAGLLGIPDRKATLDELDEAIEAQFRQEFHVER